MLNLLGTSQDLQIMDVAAAAEIEEILPPTPPEKKTVCFLCLVCLKPPSLAILFLSETD
jgi:hypothetical protein